MQRFMNLAPCLVLLASEKAQKVLKNFAQMRRFEGLTPPVTSGGRGALQLQPLSRTSLLVDHCVVPKMELKCTAIVALAFTYRQAPSELRPDVPLAQRGPESQPFPPAHTSTPMSSSNIKNPGMSPIFLNAHK